MASFVAVKIPNTPAETSDTFVNVNQVKHVQPDPDLPGASLIFFDELHAGPNVI